GRIKPYSRMPVNQISGKAAQTLNITAICAFLPEVCTNFPGNPGGRRRNHGDMKLRAKYGGFC
ncbi:hypothetical protein, partial [Citrobacter sp. RHBSTW-00671]|uniref:hypothetical protein n=1 Tax=Citrobacter sp. RHBSTW-00671 TaxID=2742660 RepID=UPI001C71313A